MFLTPVVNRRFLNGPRGLFFRRRTPSAPASSAVATLQGKKGMGALGRPGAVKPSAKSNGKSVVPPHDQKLDAAAGSVLLHSSSVDEAPKRRFFFWNRS
jgi:hypothetical protein